MKTINILIFLATCLCLPIEAKEWTPEGTVTWTAIGTPGFFKIIGEGGKTSGKVQQNNDEYSGEFWCTLADFDTGMKLRNKHMKKKYLEIAKFPKAYFKLHKSKLSKEWLPFTGELKIKDISKPITGKAKLLKDQKLTAEFAIKISDYPSIGVPKWLGITVADTVEVKVHLNY